MKPPPERSAMSERLKTFTALCPPGLTLPASFDAILRQEEPPDIEPWEWLFEYHEWLQFWVQTIKEQYPARPPLIPFAKNGGSDDVFCFDGTDTAGNPRVYIVHTFASPGWENRGYWDDFDDFMEEAEEVNAEWVRDEEEYRQQQAKDEADDQ
ncbi:SMI1/KNR4 family protein [Microbacterium protaetiae]